MSCFFTVKKPVKTYGSRTSVVQASIADEYPSVDSPASVASMDSNESSKSDAIAKAVKDKLQSRGTILLIRLPDSFSYHRTALS